jgi:hypothetical protein
MMEFRLFIGPFFGSSIFDKEDRPSHNLLPPISLGNRSVIHDAIGQKIPI